MTRLRAIARSNPLARSSLVWQRKRARIHTLSHSAATHLVGTGTDIRTVQLLLSHRSLQTTMIYTYVPEATGSVGSPLDQL